MNIQTALRFATALYIVSDSTQISYRVTLNTIFPFCPALNKPLDHVLREFLDPASLRQLYEDATDWRPMTDGEVEDYDRCADEGDALCSN
jgi:hypothetical protein